MWLIRRQTHNFKTGESGWVYVKEDDDKRLPNCHTLGYSWEDTPITATQYPRKVLADKAVHRLMIDLAYYTLSVVEIVGPLDA